MQTDSVEKAAGIGAIGLWAALHGWLGWLVVLYAVCMMLDWVILPNPAYHDCLKHRDLRHRIWPYD